MTRYPSCATSYPFGRPPRPANPYSVPVPWPYVAIIENGAREKARELNRKMAELASEASGAREQNTRIRDDAECIRKRNAELCQEREKLGWRIEQLELEVGGLRAALQRKAAAVEGPLW